MTTVILSSKYQVVIPKQVRESLHLQPGKKYQVIAYGERIEFVPVHKIREMRGIFKGINSSVGREKRDRI